MKTSALNQSSNQTGKNDDSDMKFHLAEKMNGGGRISPIVFNQNELADFQMVDSTPKQKTKLESKAPDTNILNNIMDSQSLLFTSSSQIKIRTNGSIVNMKTSEMMTNKLNKSSSGKISDDIKPFVKKSIVNKVASTSIEKTSDVSAKKMDATNVKVENNLNNFDKRIEQFLSSNLSDTIRNSQMNICKLADFSSSDGFKIAVDEKQRSSISETTIKKETPVNTDTNKSIPRNQSKPKDEPNRTRIELMDKLAKAQLKPLFKDHKIDKDQYKIVMKKIVKNCYKLSERNETKLSEIMKKMINESIKA